MDAGRIRAILLPLATLAALVALWSIANTHLGVSRNLLPPPGQVGTALWNGLVGGSMHRHVLATLEAAAWGYLIGGLIAIGLAVAVAEVRLVERFLYAPVVALQAIPKVAIAPVIFVWAGFDIGGKIALVALVCFFPIFANTLVGLRTADRGLLDLYRAVSASRMKTFIDVKLPGAAGYIFAGLQIAVVFSLIGAVVMEFVGATRGLGFMIQEASSTLDLASAFAAIVVLAALGVAANGLLRFAQRRVVFWQRDRDAAAMEL